MKTTNQHWTEIADGIRCEIKTAKDLWENALVYFQWCDQNPIMKPEVMRNSGETYNVEVPRPYTIAGLCLRLGITRDYLYDVAKSKERNEFYFVANMIIEIIYTQKLEYAITGVFNPIISAKELGLNNVHATEKGSPVINIEVQEGPKLITDERDVEI